MYSEVNTSINSLFIRTCKIVLMSNLQKHVQREEVVLYTKQNGSEVVGIEGRSHTRKTNHGNTKQVVGQLAEITVGAEVVVRFSASDTSVQWLVC